MTSGKFKSTPIDTITVNREDRQRRELVGIEELAESIHRIGLINPIVIDDDSVLVAGERRLTACKTLGWTSIPVQFASDLSEYELRVIELEENIKRVDLSWQDEVAAVQHFHKLKQSGEDGWTQEQTGEALGYSGQDVSEKIAIAEQLDTPEIKKAVTYSVARNIIRRNKERKSQTVLAEADSFVKTISKKEDKPDAVEEPDEPAIEIPLLNTDFHEWQAAYSGPKFNLIHCDFPYGINVADGQLQGASIKDHYEDSPDIYWALLDTLKLAMDNVVADSAHLIFWYSMKFHAQTQVLLEDMGWKVDPFPFIWHKSDGIGVSPDPQRGGRRTYETAFFASRGDRKITAAGTRDLSFAHPGRKTDAIHLSEKPRAVLWHFMSMVCDEYSLMLDPTCGSGNAVKVAQELEANTALGIEKDKNFFDMACHNWEK